MTNQSTKGIGPMMITTTKLGGERHLDQRKSVMLGLGRLQILQRVGLERERSRWRVGDNLHQCQRKMAWKDVNHREIKLTDNARTTFLLIMMMTDRLALVETLACEMMMSTRQALVLQRIGLTDNERPKFLLGSTMADLLHGL